MNLRSTAALVLALLLPVAAHAQRHHHHEDGPPASSATCYNPSDPNQIRLWPNRAPGAVGDDPCRDIPFLQIFPAQSRGPAPTLLLIPGGGYDHLTDAKEQLPVAQYFSQTLHVTTALLIYRLVQPDGTYRYPVPMWDGQRALKLLHARAAQLHLDPERIGLFGFSAGGHLAATLALHSGTDFGLPEHDAIDSLPAHPALLGLGYAVLSMDPAAVPPSGSYRNLLKGYTGRDLDHLQHYLSAEQNIAPRTPPVFLFESQDDARISPQNSVLFVDALHRAGLPVDAHIFPHGVHGSGLSEGIPGEDEWPELFHHWLQTQHFTAE
jgi:acetyl esterase/lipase